MGEVGDPSGDAGNSFDGSGIGGDSGSGDFGYGFDSDFDFDSGYGTDWGGDSYGGTGLGGGDFGYGADWGAEDFGVSLDPSYSDPAFSGMLDSAISNLEGFAGPSAYSGFADWSESANAASTPFSYMGLAKRLMSSTKTMGSLMKGGIPKGFLGTYAAVPGLPPSAFYDDPAKRAAIESSISRANMMADRGRQIGGLTGGVLGGPVGTAMGGILGESTMGEYGRMSSDMPGAIGKMGGANDAVGGTFGNVGDLGDSSGEYDYDLAQANQIAPSEIKLQTQNPSPDAPPAQRGRFIPRQAILYGITNPQRYAVSQDRR